MKDVFRGIPSRVAVAVTVALAVLVPPSSAQTTPTIDFTEYTYSVRSAGVGTFADRAVSRTFSAPISSLRLYIVSGQADDIGYVGSRLVTSVVPMCSAVGAVTSVQEVTDQVTINGSTASFVLRARENCCCVTGWGSATQGDRANARFRWEVVLGGCPVQPLDPITDADAVSFENGNTVNTSGLTASMQTALSCLQGEATANGGSVTVTSAYRPPAYQQHLREVWDKWESLRNNRDPECAERRADVEAEFNRHGMVYRPALNSAHTRGEAIDINWNLPAGVSIDTLADNCDLHRPVANDRVHFVLQ